jgi:hypothetical protein
MKTTTITCFCLAMLAGSSAALAADLATDDDLVAAAFEPAPPAFVPQGGGGGSSAGLPRLGVGVKVGFLTGIGVEAATSITQKSNVRGGFNFFSYTFDQTKNNTDYSLQLKLRSVQATYDWFPFGGGFHLSPGVLLYNGNQVSGTVLDAGGSSFKLGGTTYTSKTGDPVTGTAAIALNSYKASPMFLVGWGNLLKRGGGHFSVDFELGVVLSGTPKTTLALTGSACPGNQQVACLNAATDPTVQASILSQQTKINNSISFLRATPVISFGFGYKIF